MFGILKKKLGNFKEKLKQTIQKSEKEKPTQENENIIQEQVKEKPTQTKTIINENTIKEQKKTKEKIKEEAKTTEDIEKPKKETKIIKEKITQPPKETSVKEEKTTHRKTPLDLSKTSVEEKRELKTKIGATGKIKSLFTGNVEIKENEISDLLFELELSLIESDVEQSAASEIVNKIKEKLVGQKISSKNIDDLLKENIKEIISEMMETQKIDLLKEIKEKKPFCIMFLGPNGAGKTTSIAKLTHYLQKKGFSCNWAAGDTFRSGAIDQLQIHADKLNVKLIKHKYGADPAAVGFDAINSAKANNIDVVMIDTAGRQETNKNLMEELKKIERITKPNLKIYVGEAYTGQSLIEMANEFDNAIGIDGFILTKIDTDAKGGTAISLTYKIKKPILYVGTGQEYVDFEEFDTKFIIERII